MTIRVGLDFDNTIACYDQAFRECAKSLSFIPVGQATSKQEIKQTILGLADGDFKWQQVQGQVYGKFISHAALFPGVAEFLWRCRAADIEVFIVSHKTDFGHHDADRVNLRDAARDWMTKLGFFSGSRYGIHPDHLYFEYTRDAKIKRITDLNLDYFVDDLPEVLEDDNFPARTQKIFFAPSGSSHTVNVQGAFLSEHWKATADRILPPLDGSRALDIFKQAWPDLEAETIRTIRGNGNSRVYQVTSKHKSFALKIYPNLQIDSRPRLENEFLVCRSLHDFGFPVPRAVGMDQALNWGVYEWLDGVDITAERLTLMPQISDFLRNLKKFSEQTEKSNYAPASEACLTGKELTRQIDRRLDLLLAVDHSDLAGFLRSDLIPIYRDAHSKAKELMGADFDRELESNCRVLSPSDFGYHNMKLISGDRVTFYDFEYFGWDDPVKLVSDCLWHPGMNLDENETRLWSRSLKEIYGSGPGFDKRFSAYFSLFGIRWALIILNEFLKIRMAHRLNAEPDRMERLDEIRILQLKKASNLLSKIVSLN
jgi:hypothetical protein